MVSELKDKKILVTGSTGSFGPYVTDYLVEQGAEVIGTYIEEDRKEGDYLEEPDRESEAEVRSERADEVSYYAVDLTVPEELSSLKEKVEENHGKIDGIVNLVGNYMLGGIEKADKYQIETTFSIHVTAAYLTIREFRDHLEETHGSVINMSNGKVDFPIKGALSFIVSKGALNSLNKALNEELENTRVNAISPFRIDLPGNRREFPDEDFEEWTDIEDAVDTVGYLLTNDFVENSIVKI